MLKLLRNRKFQIAIIILAFLLVVLISADRFSNVNIIRNIVTVPVTWIQKGVNGIDDKINSTLDLLKNYKDLDSENKILKKEVDALEAQKANMEVLVEENEKLRNALLLKARFEGYNIIGSNVLLTKPYNYIYEYVIDSGIKDNIDFDDPVITENNALIGRVDTINYTTATIVTLFDENGGISCWIEKEKGGHITIRGDIKLKRIGLCMVENISDDINIEVGDLVTTSGLGGIYPKGIIVGKIVEIFNGESSLERYAYLEPLIEMESINQVYILTSKDEK